LVKNPQYPVISKKHLAIIAPLDWGLGHTTRCIPIIRALQEKNFDVVIACNSNQKLILQSEFPKASFVNLPGYGLSYSRHRWQTILKLIFQLPNILIAIKRENLQFKRILDQFIPNVIISDNRYGVFSSSIRSVFLTHQVKIITGAGGLADLLAASATHKWIRRFTECWVPDFEGSFNLAGKLSHPERQPSFPLRYIGPLSRFEQCGLEDGNADHASSARYAPNAHNAGNADNGGNPGNADNAGSSRNADNAGNAGNTDNAGNGRNARHTDNAGNSRNADNAGNAGDTDNAGNCRNARNAGKDYILVILSGPEPQRTILESILLKQLAAIPGKAVVVRGLPNESNKPDSSRNITILSFADTKVLNGLICDAKVVISRCGYTSVMDLFKLGKKAIFIPTPGQAEQEYLGEYLGEQKLAVIATQDKLNLSTALTLVDTIRLTPPPSMELYREVINQLEKDLDSAAASTNDQQFQSFG
jgi:predicted glycosyltransferase